MLIKRCSELCAARNVTELSIAKQYLDKIILLTPVRMIAVWLDLWLAPQKYQVYICYDSQLHLLFKYSGIFNRDHLLA